MARAAGERGVDLRVVSPGQIPRRPSDRVKTDRRDAERLVRLLAAGGLRFAHVPTVEQERFRDLVRAIEDARKDQMRARHRLSKFLLRRELRFPGKEDNWTQRHLRWLDSLRFDDSASQATFCDYLIVDGVVVGDDPAQTCACLLYELTGDQRLWETTGSSSRIRRPPGREVAGVEWQRGSATGD